MFKNGVRIVSLLLFIVMLFWNSCSKDRDHINLDGQWNFQIDSLDQGIEEKWYLTQLEDEISLPGSMAINSKGYDININTHWTAYIPDSAWYKSERYKKYRQPENIKIPFFLQPKKHYVGAAWYQKEVYIPENWDGKYIELFLERCHWETILWIDSVRIGMQNSLGTPHQYNLSKILEPGKHTITLRVDNRIKDINPGTSAHSVTDHTQTNWNGIVGDMYLEKRSPVFINDMDAFPHIKGNSITLETTIENLTDKTYEAMLNIELISDGKCTYSKNLKKAVKNETNNFELELVPKEQLELWDEFDPDVYNIQLSVTTESGCDKKRIPFGMRELNTDGEKIVINGRPIFLRGTLECAIFPKTGYPPTEEEEWTRIFKKCREYGLNHMRFHSWCPPEAAFRAADKMGFYLQPECSAWALIGNGEPIDDWLYKEAHRILENYGNHPSFCLMAYGNEPVGDNREEYLNEFVNHLKNRDNRRLYTGGTGWPAIPENDYHILLDPRVQGWDALHGAGLTNIINSQEPATDWDWQNRIDEYEKPVVSHETGQWCSYPDLSEIDQYDGVLKARNYEIFKESLEENGMGELSEKFLMASGKLQSTLYKTDIEAVFKTPGLAGFQLLDLHDFPGQGTSPVGVLNAFWKEKNYISGSEYSRFCNTVVPLVRMEKRIYKTGEKLEAILEISNFGQKTLNKVKPLWQLKNNNGEVIYQQELARRDIEFGNNILLGEINYCLDRVKAPQRIELVVKVQDYINSWDIWVFPEKQEKINDPDIEVLSKLDNNVKEKLENGKSLLFTPLKNSLKSEYGGDIRMGFTTVFWNTSWGKGLHPTTLGLLIDEDHPALNEYPTSYYADWQWWDALSNCNAIILKDFLNDQEPIVRVIDNWFENKPLGLIFEAKVGKGKMIVSGIDLLTDLEKRPEAKQLLYSLKKYMQTESFNPSSRIEFENLDKMFK